MGDTKRQKQFTKWVLKGLKKGFMQECDAAFRARYGIGDVVTDRDWEELKEAIKVN